MFDTVETKSKTVSNKVYCDFIAFVLLLPPVQFELLQNIELQES